ncbi:MAG: NUDIX domain-containing protein [Deltaproteobacteria bacterium]|nr:NUDIX domain-containing protein [Deltaproteobacteria bacterium]
MPRKIAAGCLVRARFDGETRYLVVHASGRYNRHKPYSIPKGLLEPGELPQQAALRETLEETGLCCRILEPLGEIDYQKSRKTVMGFLAEALSPVSSPVLEPGDWEIDRAEFLPPDEARAKLHPDQRAFIDRAEARSAAERRR